MMSQRSNTELIRLLYTVALSFIVFVLSCEIPIHPIQIGLDPSYYYALNLAHVENWVFGKEIFFTYGPLGFLSWLMPIGENIEKGILFWALIHSVVIIQSVRLFWQNDNRLFVLTINFALLFLLLLLSSVLLTLVLAAWLSAILYRIGGNKVDYMLAMLLAMVCFFIKFGDGVIALSGVAIFLVVKTSRFKKLLLGSLVIGCIFVTSVLLEWYFLYGSVEGVIPYFIALLQFSDGNSSAMAFFSENNWGLLCLSVVGLVVVNFVLFKGSQRYLVLSLIPAILLMFKYTFSRDDHVIGFIIFLAILSLFWLMLAEKNYTSLARCILSIVFLQVLIKSFSLYPYPYIKNFSYLGYVNLFLSFNNTKQLQSIITDFDGFKESIIIDSDEMMAMYQSGSQKSTIEDTVNSMPWDLTISYARNYKLQHTPVIQSYIAYTPWLDRVNADSIRQHGASRVFMHGFEAIDNRYIPSDVPQSFLAMLENYTVDETFMSLYLSYDRLAQPRKTEVVDRQVISLNWGEWLPVQPVGEHEYLVAKITVKPTILAKIKRGLFKDAYFSVDYQLFDGSVVTHRLAIDNAAEGVWASPYLSYVGGSSCQSIGLYERSIFEAKAIVNDLDISASVHPGLLDITSDKNVDGYWFVSDAKSYFCKFKGNTFVSQLDWLSAGPYQLYAEYDGVLQKVDASINSSAGDRFMDYEFVASKKVDRMRFWVDSSLFSNFIDVNVEKRKLLF